MKRYGRGAKPFICKACTADKGKTSLVDGALQKRDPLFPPLLVQLSRAGSLDWSSKKKEAFANCPRQPGVCEAVSAGEDMGYGLIGDWAD